MKQKYLIHKDVENQTLVIKEYAELNKEILSLLCEETYPEDAIKAAIEEGKEKLVSVLRTRNMYPPSVFANSIADLVIVLYNSAGEQSTEIFLDDKAFFEPNESNLQVRKKPVRGVMRISMAGSRTTSMRSMKKKR